MLLTKKLSPAFLIMLMLLNLSACSMYINSKDPGTTDQARSSGLLMEEISRGNSQNVRVLLSDGADPNTIGMDFRTVALIDVYLDQDQVDDLLLGSDVSRNPFRDSDITPLMVATTRRDVGTVRALLKMRANPNAKTTHGFTALTLAALSNQRGILEILLDAGAKVDARTSGGATVLVIAAVIDDKEMVKTLIKRGANVNTAAKNGWTPLLAAIRKGKTEVALLLLENNADPETQDEEGFTPLMAAASEGNARALLGLGVGLDTQNNAGLTALAIANEAGTADIVQLLTGAEGAKSGTAAK